MTGAFFFGLPLASPMQRAVCYAADTLLLINIWLIFLAISTRGEATIFSVYSTFFAFHFLYFFGWTFALGATPAKLVLGLRVVDYQGEQPVATAILIRYFVYLLTIGLPFIGILITAYMMINDPDHRTIHDRFARTLVMRKVSP